jgi:DNA-binding transcriptional LysR family regulator
MRPELRLLQYFVEVAQTGNVTRAAEQLHISQPSLSAAIQQLETQLGVALLERRGRRVFVTEAGALLAARSRELLDQVDAVVSEVRGRAASTSGRVRLGASPTSRHGVLPRVTAACAEHAPGVMLYTSEDTTGALLRDVARGALDAAVTFCAPEPLPDGLELHPLDVEEAVAHLRDDHRLAARREVTLPELAGETVLIAASRDSSGFTDRVTGAFAAAGVAPTFRPDPYPDLGLQAVREGLGIVVYARGAFPPSLPGSAFVPIVPALALPFGLVTRAQPPGAALRAVLSAATGSDQAPR